jgi:hypothetical protein
LINRSLVCFVEMTLKFWIVARSVAAIIVWGLCRLQQPQRFVILSCVPGSFFLFLYVINSIASETRFDIYKSGHVGAARQGRRRHVCHSALCDWYCAGS